MSELVARLDAIIAERIAAADAGASYVAKLAASGMDHILKKVAEECGEAIVAAKNCERGEARAELVRETADLWFHTLVMLAHAGSSGSEVLCELERRLGTSGIAEKASRSSTTKT